MQPIKPIQPVQVLIIYSFFNEGKYSTVLKMSTLPAFLAGRASEQRRRRAGGRSPGLAAHPARSLRRPRRRRRRRGRPGALLPGGVRGARRRRLLRARRQVRDGRRRVRHLRLRGVHGVAQLHQQLHALLRLHSIHRWALEKISTYPGVLGK